MITRVLSLGTAVMLFALAGCAGEDPEGVEQDVEIDSLDEAVVQHPAQGVYNHSNTVSGFPLGRCGFQGTDAVRDEQLNENNSPYVMQWDEDSEDKDFCLIIKVDPDNCAKAQDPAKCEARRTVERKIAFPLDWSGEDSCLTDAQRQKLANGREMSTIDIGTVTMSDATDPSSPVKTVGRFKIFRHRSRYQYEMMAFGGVPFKPWEGKQDLSEVRVCVAKQYTRGLGLPSGKTPRACMHFADDAREQSKFGELGTEGTAYSFYDVPTHAHCPVAFTPAAD